MNKENLFVLTFLSISIYILNHTTKCYSDNVFFHPVLFINLNFCFNFWLKEKQTFFLFIYLFSCIIWNVFFSHTKSERIQFNPFFQYDRLMFVWTVIVFYYTGRKTFKIQFSLDLLIIILFYCAIPKSIHIVFVFAYKWRCVFLASSQANIIICFSFLNNRFFLSAVICRHYYDFDSKIFVVNKRLG